MGPESVSLWLVVLGIVALSDAIIGGKYLFKIGKFLRKFLIAVAIFATAIIANHNASFAAYLHEDLYYATILIAAVLIAVLFYDTAQVIIKYDDLNERRNRRRHDHTTPAKH